MNRRISSPAVAIGFAVLAVLVTALAVPVAEVGHTSLLSHVSDPLGLAFGPVGLLLALRRPGNPIGWALLAAAVLTAVDSTASLYSVVAYRDHHALPLPWLAVLVQPSWAPAIVLFGVAVQLFPTGQVPSGRWRWVLWGFLAVGLAWAGGAFLIAAATVVRHKVRVTPGGDLVQIDHPSGATAVWGTIQHAFFPLLGLMLIAWFVRELPAYRRSTGEHRQQLKWLIGGVVIAAASGAVTVFLSGKHGLPGAIGGSAVIGIAALPLSVAIGVLNYRLYEIDRLISRTITYALLTGLLVAVYLGVVVLGTDVLPFSSPVGVAASTLAAAASVDAATPTGELNGRMSVASTTTPTNTPASRPVTITYEIVRLISRSIS